MICCGPDASLDTKIDHINLRHILMSYASYDIKCQIMSNDAYEYDMLPGLAEHPVGIICNNPVINQILLEQIGLSFLSINILLLNIVQKQILCMSSFKRDQVSDGTIIQNKHVMVQRKL